MSDVGPFLFLSEVNVGDQGRAIECVAAGLKAALPVMAGYVPIAVSFGLISHEAGLSPAMTALMSAIVYAGASQFAAASMVMAGTAIPEIVLATFFMNLRHVVMTLSIMGKLNGGSLTTRALLASGITDETFAVASFTRDKSVLTVPGMVGLLTGAWLSWWAGSTLGAHMAGFVPKALNDAMAVMLYGLFIGLLVPAVRRAPKGLVVAAVAMGSHVLLRLVLAPGWAMVGAILIGASLGPVLATRAGR